MPAGSDALKLPWKKVFVAGAGLSGRAAASWARNMGAEHVVLSDTAPLSQWDEEVVETCKREGITIDHGGHDLSMVEAADLLVPSPGIPTDSPLFQAARQGGTEVMGELALGVAFWAGPVVGITGTNGKTTTTKLISHLLETGGIPHVTGGNCAPPLLALMKHNGPDTVAVVEVSSFQLDTFPGSASALKGKKHWPRFDVALLLNLAYDHLDRYPSIDAYGESKAAMLRFQDRSCWAVLPHSDRGLDFWNGAGEAGRLYFESLTSLAPEGAKGPVRRETPGAWFMDQDTLELVWHQGTRERYELDGWPLLGLHNRSNLAAAILCARLAGARQEAVQEGIKSFKGLSHRMEIVAVNGGIRFIDDSKATNVAATLAALETLPPPVFAILGGRGKGEVYDRLAHAAARGLLHGAVLIGEEAEPLRRVLAGHVECRMARAGDGDATMREAVSLALSLAKGRGTILLSPACASFDLYKDYRARGEAFRRAVEAVCG